MSIRPGPPTFGKVSEARFLIRPADSPVHPAGRPSGRPFIRTFGRPSSNSPVSRFALLPVSRFVLLQGRHSGQLTNRLSTRPPVGCSILCPVTRGGVPFALPLSSFSFLSSCLFSLPFSSLLTLFSPLSLCLSPLPSRFASLPSRLSAPGPPVRISRVWDARKVCSSNRSCYTGTAGSSASASSQIHPSPRPPPRSVRSGSPSH